MAKKGGWFEKQKYLPSIGRRVAPEHRVAALKGCHASGLGISGRPRMSIPKTNKQRILSHKIRYGKKRLPTRGSGQSGYITLRDSDRDRVPDIYDCDPFDPSKQDLKRMMERYREAKKRAEEKKLEGYKQESERLRVKVERAEKLAEEKERLDELKERYRTAKGKTKRDIGKKLGRGLIKFGKEASEYIREEKWKEGTTRKRPSKGVKSGRSKLKKPRKKSAKRKYYYRKIKGKRVRCKMPK